MTRLFRSAFVIARRDFAATVLSKAFIVFLLGPFFPLLLGGLFGTIGARVASQAEEPVVAVVMSQAEYEALWQARHRLAQASGEDNVVELVGYPREGDVDALARRLLKSKSPPVRAVLTGWFGDPRLIGNVRDGDEIVRQVDYLLDRAAMPDGFGSPSVEVQPTSRAAASLGTDRALTAQLAQMALFFLTLLLSGMVLSQLIEEKSNKIIEVIAAAVPIDALFIGKLFAMLAASVLGLVVWVGSGAILIGLLKEGGIATLPVPAVGWPAFLTLALVYFAINYLLLGAVFLTIGGQASTAREVQTLSMPVTFAQVLIFGFAALAVGSPNSPVAFAAALFPLSSPLAMLARAAELPSIWPHLAAIGWQLLWVALILRIGARLFRRNVLKSGPASKRRCRRASA